MEYSFKKRGGKSNLNSKIEKAIERISWNMKIKISIHPEMAIQHKNPQR